MDNDKVTMENLLRYYNFLGKISFSSLNYHKSSFFVLKISKVLFSSLNFSKRTDFRSSVYFC